MVKGITITTTAITVDSSALFMPPNGDVWEFCETVGHQLRNAARSFAPPRRSYARHGTWATGAMQKSIKAAVGPVGPKNLEIMLYTDSPHAKYVLGGTASQGRNYIYTRLGYANRTTVNSWIKNRQLNFAKGETGFVMPVTRIPFKGHMALRVRGQRANPFLSDAYRLVAYRHKALPSMRFKLEGAWE